VQTEATNNPSSRIQARPLNSMVPLSTVHPLDLGPRVLQFLPCFANRHSGCAYIS